MTLIIILIILALLLGVGGLLGDLLWLLIIAGLVVLVASALGFTRRGRGSKV